MKKRIVSLLLTVCMLFSFAPVLTGCGIDLAILTDIVDEINRPDPLVEGVRGATQKDYGLIYGDAFEYYFTNPAWVSFVTEDDVEVVEFTGDCIFRDTLVHARFQFTILPDGEYFKPTFLALNGNTQTEEMMWYMLDDIFSAYQRSGK